MSLDEAASSLHAHLEGAPWLTAVGVGVEDGTPCILLYVKGLKGVDLKFLKDGWRGFPVAVRRMGTPRLVATFFPNHA